MLSSILLEAGNLGLGYGVAALGAGLAALGDILHPRARGLHHLVDGAVSTSEEFFAKAEGEIVDDLRFPVGEELPVVAALGEKAIWWVQGHGRGRK